LFTPFGLSNAAQTFQHMMDHTVDSLEALFASIDHSPPDRQTHLIHLETSFPALAANGLAINTLGHTISAADSSLWLIAVDSCPAPQNIKQLQRFLGMVNFYHCILPGCACLLQQLKLIS
jgi:hypothetical protein